MHFGKKQRYFLKKSTLKKAIIIALAAVVLLVGVIFFAENGFDPADYYPVVEILGESRVVVYRVQSLYAADEAQINDYIGTQVLPLYLPEGYSLQKAEYVTDNAEFGYTDSHEALRLRFAPTSKSEEGFTVYISRGKSLGLAFDDTAYASLEQNAELKHSAFATFGGKDLYVGKLAGSDTRFTSFDRDGRQWLVICNGMSKRELRLIVTSLFDAQ